MDLSFQFVVQVLKANSITSVVLFVLLHGNSSSNNPLFLSRISNAFHASIVDMLMQVFESLFLLLNNQAFAFLCVSVSLIFLPVSEIKFSQSFAENIPLHYPLFLQLCYQ